MHTETEADVAIRLTIEKVNADEQIVYGWASVTKDKGVEVVDQQGDILEIDVLRKAVYEFMTTARDSGVMHMAQDDGQIIKTGTIVDSLIVTADLAKVLGMDEGREGWLIGVKVDDPVIWKACKSGALRGFSIGGKAKRVPT